jgi:hypothetical protein
MQRPDGDCGLRLHHASSFGPALRLRQISGALGTIAATAYAKRQTRTSAMCYSGAVGFLVPSTARA